MAFLEAHDRVRARWFTIDALELHVGVEVFQRALDRALEVAGAGDREADRAVIQAVHFDGEVIAAPKEALVPTCGERPGGAFEGFLDAVGVGEVVAAQP